MKADDGILMTFDELSQAVKGKLVSSTEGGGFSSVAIDSRAVEPGGLFIALEGSKRDGHEFVGAAFDAGASAAMVSAGKLEDAFLGFPALIRRGKGTFIAVENTLAGLQNAAAAYLAKFPGLLRVGLTGSAGKTTTKEIAAAVIGTEKKVVMNSGNLNSETGLPLSVFQVRSHHEVGIFEAGMNRRGEIAELAAVLKPNIALITNIGSAHIGILGSKWAIAKEKKNIFSRFTGNETALIPAGDEFSEYLAEGVNGKTVFYGSGAGDAAFPELENIRDLGLEGTEITWAGRACRFGLPGNFNLKNALAALAIAREIPVGAEGVRRGLESVKPLFGRSEILYGTVTVIRDCYNSNPESLEAAVSFCDNLEWPGRRVYVIGSMLELGERSEEAHRRAGRILSASLAEKVFLYGPETETTAAVLAYGSFPFFQTDRMEDLEDALEDFVRPGDLVLLKGSRGCALERLTGVFTGEAVYNGGGY
jgi:UDP-N-acetylmuramoyl-tripeptide--D-alanyl-D-alanine ligase